MTQVARSAGQNAKPAVGSLRSGLKGNAYRFWTLKDQSHLKAPRMFLAISFLSALVGLGFAGTAALLPDTGVNGTIGAYLALLGAVGVILALGMLVTAKVPATARGVFGAIAAFLAVLTALAAWFLMQDAVLAAMVVSLLALLLSGVMAKRKAIT